MNFEKKFNIGNQAIRWGSGAMVVSNHDVAPKRNQKLTNLKARQIPVSHRNLLKVAGSIPSFLNSFFSFKI